MLYVVRALLVWALGVTSCGLFDSQLERSTE